MATLLYSLASPYARIARAVIRYLNVPNINEVISNPFENNANLVEANPLAKIPCLIFDDHCALFDSEVIIKYFDEKYGNNKLFGEKIDWQRAADFSMVKGLVDSAVGLRQEQMREEEGVRSRFWTERFEDAIVRAVKHIEAKKSNLYEVSGLSAEQLVLICALDYLDFRHPHLNWQSRAPQLAKWANKQIQKSCFLETQPK
ncbi:glutathione S-transferase [Shewanella sp. OPT22]|nr:glutathione S-transferase [Shewanella sp. OPT22]